MPELPEVETIARSLREGRPNQPSILGKRIVDVNLLWRRTLATPSSEEFKTGLTGQVVQEVGRRGKFLTISLSANQTLLLHLRMSGDLVLRSNESPPAPHDRLILSFEDNLCLAFNDTRKFGRVWLVSDPQPVLESLGPEPLDPSFTAEDLFYRLRAYHRQLKPLLMDQTFLAGLGNIYTDEALHMAGIHPLTPSDSLTSLEANRLWQSIRHVLQEGIRLSGASIDWVYRGGEFQNHFRVYKRTGEPCPICGAGIKKIIVGQRGTHYCPNCQVSPPERANKNSGEIP
jgi:formamidopyrimidine-DNA glycosylase